MKRRCKDFKIENINWKIRQERAYKHDEYSYNVNGEPCVRAASEAKWHTVYRDDLRRSNLTVNSLYQTKQIKVFAKQNVCSS